MIDASTRSISASTRAISLSTSGVSIALVGSAARVLPLVAKTPNITPTGAPARSDAHILTLHAFPPLHGLPRAEGHAGHAEEYHNSRPRIILQVTRWSSPLMSAFGQKR